MLCVEKKQGSEIESKAGAGPSWRNGQCGGHRPGEATAVRAACVVGVVGASARGQAGAGHLVSPAIESTSALLLNEVDTLEGSERGDMTWLMSSQRYFGTSTEARVGAGTPGGPLQGWTVVKPWREVVRRDVGRTWSLWDLRPG